MNLFQPVVGGFAALVVGGLVLNVPLFIAMLRYSANDRYCFEIQLRPWTALCVSVLLFSGGFLWQYRKARFR